MRISDWSSDVCSSDLRIVGVRRGSVVVHGADMDRWTLAEGDRLILRVDAATLLTWREQGRFRLGIGSGDPAEGDMVVETMVAPTHPSIGQRRWEEHTSELQSLMRISYVVFCFINKTSQYAH